MSIEDSMRRTIAEQHDEIGALKAENAKLRERIDDAHMSRLLTENENESLRELVLDMWGIMWACSEQRCTHRHEGCFRVRGNHGDICASERCWYEDRMRELGIEVDG